MIGCDAITKKKQNQSHGENICVVRWMEKKCEEKLEASQIFGPKQKMWCVSYITISKRSTFLKYKESKSKYARICDDSICEKQLNNTFPRIQRLVADGSLEIILFYPMSVQDAKFAYVLRCLLRVFQPL